MTARYGTVSAYFESMYRLSKTTLEIVRHRGLHPDAHSTALRTSIEHFRTEIDAILKNSAEHLKDVRRCRSTQDLLEYWGLYLHVSFVLAELCRPALHAARSADAYREVCIENLINTIDAYLGLQQVTAYARQSWAAVHRALSCALLLGILGEHNQNNRARQLLVRFIGTMQDITVNIDPAEIAAPLQRGINALQKLNIADVKFEPSLAVADGSTLDADGSLRLQSSILTPAQSTEEWLEYSPHSILNTILWGADGPAGNPTPLPMPW